MKQRPSKTNHKVFALIVMLFSSVVSLTVAEQVLKYHRQHISESDDMDAGLMTYDALLGWRLTRNWQGDHRHYDYLAHYATNAHGFRGTFSEKTRELTRINAVVGDSFTFGFGVSAGETFVDLLNENQLTGDDVFYNFGVPGYSTDQEWLLIRDKVLSFNPDHVFLVVYLYNDLIDNSLKFPMQASRGKPYFELHSGNLRLRNTPVPLEQSNPRDRRDQIARILFGEIRQSRGLLSEYLNAFELTRWLTPFVMTVPALSIESVGRLETHFALFRSIVLRIQEACLAQGVEFSLVLLPGRSFLQQESSLSGRFQAYVRERLLLDFDNADMDVIDLAAGIQAAAEAAGTPLYFPNEGHLNLAGHKLVATLLAEHLNGKDSD